MASSHNHTSRPVEKTVGWTLACWAVAQLAGMVLEQNEVGALAVQAAVAEWGAGRVGVTWSDALVPAASLRQVARRVAVGGAVGFGAAGLALCASLLAREVTLAPAAFSPAALTVGLLVACLSAVRDELILRGMVLRGFGQSAPAWVGVCICGASAAAARWGLDGAPSIAVAVDAAFGVALGALWLRDRGAWLAWSANTAYHWTVACVVRGGLVAVLPRARAEGSLTPLCAAAAIGAAAWLLPLRARRVT